MMDCDVIIIGAGLGGLVCGSLLTRRGRRVIIFEKRTRVGGCCTSLTRRGFTFDLSVQSIGGYREGERTWMLLDHLGLREKIELIHLDPAREYYFPDRVICQHADVSSHVDYLSSLFPGEQEGIRRIYQIYSTIAEEIDRFPQTLSWFDPARFAREFPATFQYRDTALQDILDAHITDTKLKVILGVRSSYALLPPSRLSLIAMAVLEMSYLRGGVAVVKEKMERLPQLLATEFQASGGQIHTRHEVKKIMIQGGKAVGVQLKGGETVTSHVVVSNADATATFLRMVGEGSLPSGWVKRLMGMQPSLSYFIVYLGLEGPIDLTHSNNEVFPRYDLEEEYRYLDQGAISPTPPYYLLAPSLVNPSHAPAGCSTVCLSYKAPYQFARGWNGGAREALAERIIAQAEPMIPNLRRRIALQVRSTPVTIERMTGNRWGAAYGWAQIPRHAGIYRLNRASPLDGLYLAGHWTAPGGGVAAAMASGQITADLIEGRLQEGVG